MRKMEELKQFQAYSSLVFLQYQACSVRATRKQILRVACNAKNNLRLPHLKEGSLRCRTLRFRLA